MNNKNLELQYVFIYNVTKLGANPWSTFSRFSDSVRLGMRSGSSTQLSYSAKHKRIKFAGNYKGASFGDLAYFPDSREYKCCQGLKTKS